MIGALIGWQGILFTIFFSSLSGTFIGLLLTLPAGRSMKSRLPFGPFLAAGTVIAVFVGQDIVDVNVDRQHHSSSWVIWLTGLDM